MTTLRIRLIACFALLASLLFGDDAVVAETSKSSTDSLWGNWALVMPDGAAGWLKLSLKDGKASGELWTVGSPKQLTDVKLVGDRIHFKRKCRVGKPEYEGGPPTGDRIACQHTATAKGNNIQLVMSKPVSDDKTEKLTSHGKRIPPLPPKPDMDKVKFGEPIQLFNGRNLDGWMLTNSKQANGWKAVDGVLVNTTPKLDFSPYSRYGNLRTKRKFMDFNLKIEFKLPRGGNSGIYLRGVYEAQVLNRDSRMQGIQGVGAIFGRIKPAMNAGRLGNQWNQYDITLVDRHATVILNGQKVIDNQPIAGCTNGALHADETIPGPLYLQGDHTTVSYRNIVLRPVIERQK
ncbi:MAG: glycosyl hydrolase [Planctomycetaceae bacterium]|nr:glycosyl hydrolase [Planctomycetaceae bacterium]